MNDGTNTANTAATLTREQAELATPQELEAHITDLLGIPPLRGRVTTHRNNLGQSVAELTFMLDSDAHWATSLLLRDKTLYVATIATRGRTIRVTID